MVGMYEYLWQRIKIFRPDKARWRFSESLLATSGTKLYSTYGFCPDVANRFLYVR
jgi:hypothetical protein